MRGVYPPSTPLARRRRGSSPHARGLRKRLLGHPVDTRIIPACAGFTRCECHSHRFYTDHPRMRGVYDPGDRPDPVRPGSSPHARGLQGFGIGWVSGLRIIPACAGFTRAPSAAESVLRDHPRMRGVYGRGPGYGLGGGGGIIPACAGFTPPRGPGSPTRPEHPPMRGVYGGTFNFTSSPQGSSPHARGLHLPRRHHDPPLRIIPACAGFTALGVRGHQVQGDHPRMRGVYSRTASVERVRRGSSPHARGLLGCPGPAPGYGRIIPACAGFTRSRPGSRPSRTDHPRMRGVYSSLLRMKLMPRGSSPHARGLPYPLLSIASRVRIIPACAGFTRRSCTRRPSSRDHPRMRGVYS